MYKEKSFKRTITILRVRRYLGLVASWFAVRTLIELLDFPKTIIPVVMIAVGVTIFLIAFILSSNVEFKIKQAKLEMEIYNKLRLNTAMLTKLLAINGIALNQDNPLVDSTDIIPADQLKPMRKVHARRGRPKKSPTPNEQDISNIH